MKENWCGGAAVVDNIKQCFQFKNLNYAMKKQEHNIGRKDEDLQIYVGKDSHSIIR